MGLLNQTTEIPAEQTIGEIQKMLSSHGVMSMMTDYDGPYVSAVSFRMNINGTIITFRLPCNWRAVLEIFNNAQGEPRFSDPKKIASILERRKDQAIKTAWRIIHTWTKAQLALVEVNMVTIPQVFLPYAVMKGGLTLSEKMSDDPQFLLDNG